jgi:protein-S-isoprenylcysteine O-methyltransferase Ste14
MKQSRLARNEDFRMDSGFWWILIAMGIYGTIHTILAGDRARSLAQRWFGTAGRRWFRLGFNLIAVLTFIPVLALIRQLPDAELYRIPMPLQLLTMALEATCILAMLLALHETGLLCFLGLAPDDDAIPPHLVTEGLYRYVRHPLYSLGLVVVWLLPVMTRNALFLNVGITLYILVGAAFEERKLLRKFGAAYAEYRQKIPMFIPWPLRSHPSQTKPE